MTTSHALSPELMLSVRGLSVSFRQHQQVVQAVNNLSFEVKKGETLAIVGESGSGKSVTSLALMRLIEQSGGQIDQGEIWLRRRDNSLVNMTETPSSVLRRIRGADIAMIFQEPMTSLNPVFPVGEQIAESIRLHQGKNHQQARSEALRMLDLVRMPDATGVFSRYPHQLSGGQRQRIMIAMAISCRPGMLIADEPTTALDVTVQAQILQLIRELQQELQMGVLFITHDMGVVAEIADRILVMRQGEQVESEAAETLFSHPQQPYTRALLAAIPRLGAMRGEPFPRYFPLPGEAEQRDTLQNTVQSDAEPLLTVRGLVTRFDLRGGILNRVQRRVHAVESISFDLRAGETLALVGESGCGKSTTARALLRLVQSQQGEIHFDGQRIDTLTAAQFAPLRRDIQLVFQDPYASLDPRLTVGFSIMEPLLIHGVAKGKIAEKRVAELLERVGLQPEHASRYPHEFSGGQRQRICIARALALQPKMIIADESVSALDVSVQAQIINLLLDLQRETGIAFLFISHDMAVVERVSHRVAVMYLGQIVEIGSRQAVFENPQHPYTRQLMSAVPIADPARRWQKKNVITADIPSPVRAVGDEPGLVQLVEIEQGHYVARHATG